LTPQRAIVAKTLRDAGEFRSAQQLHEVLRAQGNSVGLATVYRAVQALADSGEVDTRYAEDGQTVYRWCSRREHHHHLVCRRCGKTIEISGSGVETWARTVGVEHNFADIEHTVELTGMCPDCAVAGT
jgi:Fur family ferric uptake transcriptional regulator